MRSHPTLRTPTIKEVFPFRSKREGGRHPHPPSPFSLRGRRGRARCPFSPGGKRNSGMRGKGGPCRLGSPLGVIPDMIGNPGGGGPPRLWIPVFTGMTGGEAGMTEGGRGCRRRRKETEVSTPSVLPIPLQPAEPGVFMLPRIRPFPVCGPPSSPRRRDSAKSARRVSQPSTWHATPGRQAKGKSR